MSQVKSKNTKPEIIVRSLLHQLDYRFRLHRKDLPGKPDIILPKYKTVIFIHGCFWHIHNCRKGKSKPSTNAEFWKTKRESNVERDNNIQCILKNNGWKVVVIWEFQTRNIDNLRKILLSFLLSS